MSAHIRLIAVYACRIAETPTGDSKVQVPPGCEEAWTTTHVTAPTRFVESRGD